VPLGEPPEPSPPPAEGARRLRFTPGEDPDGSRFVWFLLDRAGIPCEYLPAGEFPSSTRWEPVRRDRRGPGDVAWWKGFVALYQGARPEGELSTAAGRRRLADLEARLGAARFLRRLDPPPLRPVSRSLGALGRTVRFENPDPGAWTEDQPRRGPAAVLLSLRRRPLREPGGGQAVPVIALRVAAAGLGAPAASLGIPPEARAVGSEEAPGGRQRLLTWGGDAAAFRALELSRDEAGLSLAAACSASETAWRVVERECLAFLASLAVEPAR
jgi:hypothetical protein